MTSISNGACVITYIRFDGTGLSNISGILKNFYVVIYHLDGKKIPPNANLDVLKQITNNRNNIRQKFITGSIIGSDVAEWDNLNISLLNLDSDSAVIAFVCRKYRTTQFIKMEDEIVDHYNIVNAHFVLQNNSSLVYNTDNMYLLQMNSALDTYTTLSNNGSEEAPLIEIMNNTTIKNMYESIYHTILNRHIDEDLENTENNTPEQIKKNRKIIEKMLLQDTEKMQLIETEAIKELNDQYRSIVYGKYLGTKQLSEETTDELLEAINQNIHQIKCIIPSSSITPTVSFPSKIRLSVHYVM